MIGTLERLDRHSVEVQRVKMMIDRELARTESNDMLHVLLLGSFTSQSLVDPFTIL